MAEVLDVYDLDGNFIGNQDRASFYSEAREKYLGGELVTKQVRTVKLLLMNSKGKIYLQLRSKDKSDNAGLFDKSVGGHLSIGESPNLAIIRESAEELGLASAVVSNGEFDQAVRSIDLSRLALIKKIDEVNAFPSLRVNQDGVSFVQPLLNTFYVGYYDGPIQFIDGESEGIKTFSVEDLECEMKMNPKLFTEDIKYMIEKYKEHLVALGD